MTIRTIQQRELDGLGIDDETNELYWRGRLVVTKMSLPWWVHWGVIVTALGTFVIAAASVIALFK